MNKELNRNDEVPPIKKRKWDICICCLGMLQEETWDECIMKIKEVLCVKR